MKAAITPDSRYLLSPQGRAIVKIDLRNGKEVARNNLIEDDQGWSWQEVSPDGRTLALARPGGQILLVDARTLKLRKTLETKAASSIVVGFARGGSLLVAVSSSGRIFHFKGR